MEKSYVLNNVAYEYESKATEKGFRLGPLSFDIPTGRTTFICGRSGSGKSTLLAIMGLLRTEFEGHMKINQLNAQEIKANRKNLFKYRLDNIGFALQKGRLLPYLTVKENSSFILEYTGINADKVESRCNEIFKKLFKVELDEDQLDKVKDKDSYNRILNSLPEDISGGQYQRAAMARALINSPSIILADEPTGNLDVNSGEKTMELLKEYLSEKENSTVIIVSHDLEYARLYADKIIVLKKGLISADIVKNNNGTWTNNEKVIQPSEVEAFLNSKIKDDA